MERYPLRTDTWEAWHKVYDSLSSDDKTDAGKKRKLLGKAMTTLRDLTKDPDGTQPPTMGAYCLGKEERDYVQTGSQVPECLKAAFDTRSATPALENQAEVYSYERTGQDRADDFRLWVDFAAKSIGGGAFDDGFVEEEHMVLETPDLAAFAANGYDSNEKYDKRPRTREGDSGVMEGNPTPLLFKGARRVTEISEKYYGGDALRNTDCTTLLDNTKKLDDIQTVVVLAMAAPYLDNQPKTPGPHDVETIKDLYNTFVAGFTLAREALDTNQRLILNTGAIGCGAFHNSREVVFVLQILAARQVGKVQTLRFWKCSDAGEVSHCLDKAGRIVKDYSSQGMKSVAEMLSYAGTHWDTV